MIHRLRDWVTEPVVRGLDPEGIDITLAHRNVLLKKAMLRKLFEGFYRNCRDMDLRYFGNCPGARIEVGSGSSFMKEVLPDVLTSDVRQLLFVDLVARAEQLPFAESSLRAVYAINVFHHLPDPREFFRELLRVLHPGGGAVLIEPYYGPVARFVFKHIHAVEGFDMETLGWNAPDNSTLSTNTNQALSYIVFTRDREILKREIPGLEVVSDRPHTQLSYVLSGGVNFRQLVPNSLVSAGPHGRSLVEATGPRDCPVAHYCAAENEVVTLSRRTREVYIVRGKE